MGRCHGLRATRCDNVLAVDCSCRQIELAEAKAGHLTSTAAFATCSRSPDEDGWFGLVLAVDTPSWLGSRGRGLPHDFSLVGPGWLAVVIGPADLGGWRSLGWPITAASAPLRSQRACCAWPGLTMSEEKSPK